MTSHPISESIGSFVRPTQVTLFGGTCVTSARQFRQHSANDLLSRICSDLRNLLNTVPGCVRTSQEEPTGSSLIHFRSPKKKAERVELQTVCAHMIQL